jgi:NAD-dependent dihydropyrimidine dehydrogenase PreA subunit
MIRKTPIVDYALCMACGVCVMACPFGSLDLTALRREPYGNAYPELVRPASCTGCGLCAKACPLDCLAMSEGS